MIRSSGSSCLLMLCLLTSQRTFVVAIPERRDELLRREYPLEDFLWTGSGDGPERDEGQISWVTTTVFKTTTRLVATPVSATFTMVTAATCPGEKAPCLTPSWQLESSAMLEPSFTDSHQMESSFPPSIWATPTISVVATATATLLPTNRPPVWPADFDTPDKKFWIVTVVEEGEIESPQQSPFEAGLSRLYATAFKRQQEKHLGILNATSARRMELQRKRRSPEVLVRLLNVTKESPKRIQLVYLVQVKGQPVLARAAVHDMKLVSDAEVAQELKMNVLTKAEPYLKEKEEAVEQGSQVMTASPWVLAAVSISVVSLLGLVAVLLYLATTKKKRTNRLVDGATNMSFEPEVQSCGSGAKMSEDWSVEALEEGQQPGERAKSAIDAAKTVARGVRKNSKPPSPTGSYLSMPSVRKFPRGDIVPKPLTQILQQDDLKKDHLSLKNLDVYPDESAFEPPSASSPPAHLVVRHGSLNGDPGVVGPCVYQMARGAATSRRRFQELVDDTYSLFGEQRIFPERKCGSRSPSPPPRPPSPKVDSRVHSAAYLRVSSPADSPPAPRPRTTEPRRPSLMQQPRRRPLLPASRASSAGPRGAWETPGEPATAGIRPLSAGPFHRPLRDAGRPPAHPPRICADYILADSQLGQADPAMPLISAIKSELQKFHSCSSCSIPGSISPSPNLPLDDDKDKAQSSSDKDGKEN
ncbi:uncharacterized protein LOC132201358 [Neocloeon triangulifer]|uniref:uncharacterized protein LOC132201358 n=1 Tax=Neocloeon triangulifer TaxID=2078957 RepID=UPI00286F2896|nr:uncharacterized protein LOC132201358 [Neocloeon triangulifer]